MGGDDEQVGCEERAAHPSARPTHPCQDVCDPDSSLPGNYWHSVGQGGETMFLSIHLMWEFQQFPKLKMCVMSETDYSVSQFIFNLVAIYLPRCYLFIFIFHLLYKLMKLDF
jgi:hypothetical protein